MYRSINCHEVNSYVISPRQEIVHCQHPREQYPGLIIQYPASNSVWVLQKRNCIVYIVTLICENHLCWYMYLKFFYLKCCRMFYWKIMENNGWKISQSMVSVVIPFYCVKMLLSSQSWRLFPKLFSKSFIILH